MAAQTTKTADRPTHIMALTSLKTKAQQPKIVYCPLPVLEIAGVLIIAVFLLFSFMCVCACGHGGGWVLLGGTVQRDPVIYLIDVLTLVAEIHPGGKEGHRCMDPTKTVLSSALCHLKS